MGQVVGYKRVSSNDQSLARQLEGVRLDKEFSDHLSGKSLARPGLEQMIAYVREGDEVVVHSLDRLGRNLSDLLAITQQLGDKGVVVRFHKEGLMIDGAETSVSKMTMHILASFAEFERSLIRERQAEGISLAKAAGKYRGRTPKVDDLLASQIRESVSKGEQKADIARRLGISRATVYRVISTWRVGVALDKSPT